MSEDNELEAIKQKKLAELQKAASARATMSGLTEPIVLNDSNFASEVAKYPVMLVDFWAPWCGPCRMIGPVIEELAGEYTGSVKIGKLNIDDSPGAAQSYGVSSIPTLMIFKGGEVVDRMVGVPTKARLQEALDAAKG